MKGYKNYSYNSEAKSWFLEDDLSGIDQPKMEDILRTCNLLSLAFNKRNVIGLLYGDNTDMPERVFPFWISQIPE